MAKRLSHISNKKQSHIAVRKTPFVPATPNTGAEPQDAIPPSAVAQAMAQPMQIPAPGIAGGVPSQGPRVMKTGGKTVNEKVLVHRGEKIDVGVDDTVHYREETPNERDRRDPPVRLKWGVDEDTATNVNKTSAKKIPLGSTVTPAPTTSGSNSPRSIAVRDQKIRFQF